MIARALVAESLKPFVLSILAEGERYGYEIIQRIQDLTNCQKQWTSGTLYPLLHSLEIKGLLASVWREREGGPKRKYYWLTAKGQKTLDVEKRQWLSVHAALVRLWGPTPGLAPT